MQKDARRWQIEYMLGSLAQSKFRNSFKLREKERTYIEQKGFDTIRRHAYDFIEKRLSPAIIPNDGKQTPMRGHPCFPAQHATGCCCRSCLQKWHGIPPGRPLTEAEIQRILDILLRWIREHSDGADSIPHTPDLF